MIIDTHCHLDLYERPELIVKECEEQNILTIGVTNLPSHFQVGLPHVKLCKRVRLALGMHPLYAIKHKDEFSLFLNNINKTSYIGEVGLDFSREGITTKEIQIRTFTKILENIQGKKKILSIHSRRAEKEVLELLINYKIPNAIFHWYTGSQSLIKRIVESGYYFSINPSMIESESGKKNISKIPLNHILTESDGPFIKVNNKQIKPHNVSLVIDYLSKERNLTKVEIENVIFNNFKKLISSIK